MPTPLSDMPVSGTILVTTTHPHAWHRVAVGMVWRARVR